MPQQSLPDAPSVELGGPAPWLAVRSAPSFHGYGDFGTWLRIPLQKHRARCPWPSAREGELRLRIARHVDPLIRCGLGGW